MKGVTVSPSLFAHADLGWEGDAEAEVWCAQLFCLLTHPRAILELIVDILAWIECLSFQLQCRHIDAGLIHYQCLGQASDRKFVKMETALYTIIGIIASCVNQSRLYVCLELQPQCEKSESGQL